MKNRIELVREKMKEMGLEAIIIGSKANRRYLSGFSGSSGMVYLSMAEQVLITDFRYIEQVAKECSDFKCIDQKELGLYGTAAQLARKEGLRKIGFEAEHTTVSTYDKLKTLDLDWQPTKQIIEDLRKLKDTEELRRLKMAEHIGDLAFTAVVEYIEANWKKGLTETQVALEIERVMRVNGASGNSFDSIVASGAKSALPHATPNNDKLKCGDFLVMDFGCIYEGYCSDMTRTIVLGEASRRHMEIYEIVLRAQKAALEAIRPGMTGAQVDYVARDIIEKAGYGEYFGHGLGHSVGLEIHESPRFSKLDQTVIEAGMIMTVEPGIYIPDFGGVRIEDLVQVTENGIINFTHSPKELIIVK